jgi:hypothetical protein
MAIEGGIGVSTNDDLAGAAVEAAREASASCPNPTAVLMFVTHSYGAEGLVGGIRAAKDIFPGAPVVGGTVNGITHGDNRYDAMYANRRAVAVVAFGGDVRAGASLVADPNGDPVEAGRTLVTEARDRLGKTSTGAVILTPGMAGFNVIDQGILNGIRSVNPRLRITGTGLCGGLAPDSSIIPGWAFLDDRIERNGAALLCFAGARMGFSSANGMEAVGPGGFVTDAEGPIIKTIDNRPAKDAILDLMCGDDAIARSHFERSAFIAMVERGITLGAADPEGTHYWCHMPVVLLPDGSALDPFIARRGMPLSLVRIDPKSCMNAVVDAGNMLVEDTGTDDFDFTLAFSCALRGYTLGADFAHEDVGLRNIVKSKRHIGVVANGEVACHRQGRPFATGWVYALFGLAGEGR